MIYTFCFLSLALKTFFETEFLFLVLFSPFPTVLSQLHIIKYDKILPILVLFEIHLILLHHSLQ